MNRGYAQTKKAIQRSLDACGLGYIDLYLIHGPLGGPQARKDSWRAICDAQRDGHLKSIGISTFGIRHIQDLLDEGLPVPTVHQVDPYKLVSGLLDPLITAINRSICIRFRSEATL